MSHGILILIEWSKVQYIKKWIILVIRLMKYEDFCSKCVYVFDISKIDILGKKAWKFSGNITVHWTNAPRICDHNGGGKVQNMKKVNTFVIKLVKYWWLLSKMHVFSYRA